jgi:DNA-binding MarR family transcriptional regulator
LAGNVSDAAVAEIRILTAVLTKRSRQALEKRLDAYCAGVSGLQFRILRALSSEEQTISGLSRRFMRSPSTLVPAIDALEQRGLVRRGQDPKDRRRTPLSLTAIGASLLDEVPFLDDGDPLVRALEATGDEHALQLLSLLREVVANLPDGESILSSVASRVRLYTASRHDPGSTRAERRLVSQ